MMKHIEALRQDADAKANKVTQLQGRVKRLRWLSVVLFTLLLWMIGVGYVSVATNMDLQDENERLELRVSELEGLK